VPGEVFDGVSCPTPKVCIAVGSSGFFPRSRPVAARWDGTRWSLLNVPSPDGAILTGLSGVSCPSVSACTAVGSWTPLVVPDEPLPFRPLAERWDGTRWTIQPAVQVDFLTQFLAVSCATATACTAVGWGHTSLNGVCGCGVIAEQWNGQDWTVTLAGYGYTETLSSVSCTSASACMAVGVAYSPTLREEVTAALRWDGLQWSDVSPPSGLRAGGGVSCAAPFVCMTGGGGRWNGRTWIQTNGGGLAVSCPVSTICTAVSWYRPNPPLYEVRTLAERYS